MVSIHGLNIIQHTGGAAQLRRGKMHSIFTTPPARTEATHANQSFYGLKNNLLLAIDCYLLVAHKIGIIAVSIMVILLYNWWPLISHY